MTLFEACGSIKEATFLLIITLVVLILTSILSKWIKMYTHFSKLNIPGPKPLPFFGNFFDIYNRGMAYNDFAMIKKYGKTFGYFEGASPIVLTIDEKLLKSILIKDFNVFTNRRLIESANIQPFNRFVSLIKDDEWKRVRSILTTMFTSGKLKSMSKLINQCVDELIEHFNELSEKDGIFNTKDYFGGLSLNIICSCCIGISVDSIKEPNNEFLKHIKKFFFDSDGNMNITLIFIMLFPKLVEIVAKRGLIPTESLDYLKNLNVQIIQRRKEKLEYRDDFIQIMLEYEEQQLKESEQNEGEDTSDKNFNEKYLRKALSYEEIFSQSIMFLLAGYETTANTLGFIAYNLATNPKQQDKLIQEIDEVLADHNGQVNYDSVSQMKYMNMVIDETLRIFPTTIRFDRVANENYEFEGMKIEKGQVVAVPIWALHHDPELYSDPERFDPERFNEENKKKRDNNSYLPFGNGPRNCLGMRFALLEIKLCMAKVLSRFKFETCEKTPKKIEIDNSGLGRSKEPIFLKITNRF